MPEFVGDYTAKARALGAKVVVPQQAVPERGWFAHLLDPGNRFAIRQDAQRPTQL